MGERDAGEDGGGLMRQQEGRVESPVERKTQGKEGEEWRQKERGAAVKVAPGLEGLSFLPSFPPPPAHTSPCRPTFQLPHAEKGLPFA